MSTYSDYISSALQIIGVLDEIQSASAEQGSHGLTVFNDMMADWEALGINLAYVPASSASAKLEIAPRYRQGVKANLALRLCAYYGSTPSAMLVAMAIDGYGRVLKDAVAGQMTVTDLGTMTSGGATESILTG